MHHPTDRITHTTAFVTPVVEHWLEREIAQWVHPMKGYVCICMYVYVCVCVCLCVCMCVCVFIWVDERMYVGI